MNEVTAEKQSTGQDPRGAKRNSGLFSIFKWFKSSSTSRESVNSDSLTSSSTGSCDSVHSTYSTGTVASFSFVPPHAYKNDIKGKSIVPQPETDTYRARLNQRDKIKERDKNISLRKKYNLFFNGDTLLKPPVNEEDNSKSLPLMTKKVMNKEEERMHRRTASESSKIKKAGAYCHVKGKRKAPAPPLVSQTSEDNGTTSWRRKKRVAPAPPAVTKMNYETIQYADADIIFNDSLKLDHGILKSAKEDQTKPSVAGALSVNALSPSSPNSASSSCVETPVSPRPWYKRNSGVPRREHPPEHSRNDLNIEDSRIDKKKDDKRKSGLSFLTNISELDREATEILKKEKEEAAVVNEMPAFMRPKSEQPTVTDTLVTPKRKSAKDLIAKFNAITNVTKVTVNAFHRDKKDYFGGKSSKQQDSKKITSRKSGNDTVLNPLMKSESASVIKSQSSIDKKTTPKTERRPWNCPKCSIQNEYWRIICHVCSTIKPYFDDLAPTSSKSCKNSPEKVIKLENKNITPKPSELIGTLERSHTQIGFSALTRYNVQKIERSSSVEGKEEAVVENKKEEREKLMKMLIDMKNSLPKRKLSAGKDNKRTSIIEEGLEMLDNEAKLKEKIKQDVIEKDNKIKTEDTKLPIKNDGTENDQQNLKKVSIKSGAEVLKLNGTKASEIPKPADRISPEKSPPKTAEVILVTQDTIYENIKVKTTDNPKPIKVSSSAQTSAVVRKTTPDSITGAIKKDGRFELMKATDFADIYNEKSGKPGNNMYANFGAVQDNMSLFVNMPKKFAELKSNLTTNEFMNNTDTLEINRLLRRLENAIAKGELTDASIYARELAQLKVNCSVVRQKQMKDAIGKKKTGEFTIDMFVEDRLSHRGPFPIRVTMDKTVGELKQQVEKEFEIPAAVQRWILGKELATDDNNTLKDHHVTSEGCPIFLYLVAPTRDSKILIENKKTEPTVKSDATTPAETEKPPEPKQNQEIKTPIIKNEVKIVDFKIKEPPPKIETHIDIRIEEKPIPKKLDTIAIQPSTSVIATTQVSKVSAHSEISTSSTSEVRAPNAEEEEDLDEYDCKTLKPQRKDWECRMCTLLNPISSNICAVCAFVRPTITPRAATRRKAAAQPNNKRKEATNAQHYQQLVNLDSTDLVENTETFECIVCLTDVDKGEGVTLRECLHQFCKLCLAHTVEFTDEAEVKCPYRDDQYSCDIALQDREIKALVTPVVYEQYLARSVAQAENKTEKSFHCKTPDCKGWCIFEDNVNDFRCPVCKKINCLTCQAIHSGLNCKQYQERMNLESEVDEDARRTREMLEEMVNKGEALTCPACQVILMKKWGCDWVRCSMCKTEICWVTRGPRWGPAGKGDTSGGCKCGVNGVKCHAQCNYCH